MERIFENPSTFAVIAGKIDGNFLSVANSLHRFAYPTHTVKGFAINDPDETPSTGDAYVVSAAGTVWGLSVVANDVIYWNGTAWAKSPTNLADIASGITASTTAAGVSFDNTGTAFTGATVQAVLGETDTRMTTAEGEIDTLQTTVTGIETLLAAI